MARRNATYKPGKKKKPKTGFGIPTVGTKGPPPAPAPSYTPQVQPLDPTYLEQTGLNQLNLDTTLAGIQYQQGRVGQEYGFNALGQLDPSNPYNRATMLQRAYQQGQRGTTNSMAGRGQLYAGAHQRNLDEGTFTYSRNFDSLRRGAADAYHGLSQQEQQARSEFDQSNLDASSDAAGRAADNRPVDPGPYAGIDFSALDRLIKSEKKPKPKGRTATYKRGTIPGGRTRIG